MSMNCQFCGAEIPENAAFCGRCGARAPAASGGAAPASGGEPPSAAPEAGQQQAPPAYGQQQPYGQQPPYGYSARQRYFEGDPNMPQRPQYASFGARFGAWLLDLIFALVPALILGVIIGFVVLALVESGQEAPRTVFESDQQDDDSVLGFISGMSIGAGLAFFFYQWIANAVGGGFGKRIVGLRIIKRDSGQAPGAGGGFLRALIPVLLSWVPLAGSILWILDGVSMTWDEGKQTWHDKAAGTIVVRA